MKVTKVFHFGMKKTKKNDSFREIKRQKITVSLFLLRCDLTGKMVSEFHSLLIVSQQQQLSCYFVDGPLFDDTECERGLWPDSLDGPEVLF